MNLETVKAQFATLADQWKTVRKEKAHLLLVVATTTETKLENMKKEIAFALTLIAAQPAADSKDALTAHQTYKSVVDCQANDVALFELLRQDETTKANIIKLRAWIKSVFGGKGDGDKDEDVPESEFVGVIRGWITQILTDLESIKSDYTDGAFDFATAAKKLPSFLTKENGGSNYPIVGKLAVAIQVAARPTTTLSSCADACIAALGNFDDTYLSIEYKDGKQKYYGNKALTASAVITNTLPTRTDFHNALVAGCAECKLNTEIASKKAEVINKFKSSLDKWRSEIYVLLDTARYEKTLQVSGQMVFSSLQEAFNAMPSTDPYMKKVQLYVCNTFAGSTFLPINDAITALKNSITALQKNAELVDLYAAELAQNPLYVAMYPTNNTIADAITNAKIGAAGDSVAQDKFVAMMEAWRNTQLSVLNSKKGDDSNTINVDWTKGAADASKSSCNQIFNGFWDKADSALSDAFISVAEVRHKIQSALRNIDFASSYADWQDDRNKSYPNIAYLDSLIVSATLDTSFTTYLANWQTWQRNIGRKPLDVADSAKFKISFLKYAFTSLFVESQFMDRPIAPFVKKKFDENLDTFQVAMKSDEVNGKDLKDIYFRTMDAASPINEDYNSVVKNLMPIQKSNFIAGYANTLPSIQEINEAISLAQINKPASGGGSSYKTTYNVVLNFTSLDSTGRKVRFDRVISVDITAAVGRTDNQYYIKSLKAGQVKATAGLSLDGDIKITGGAKKLLGSSGLEQSFKLVVKVDSFGEDSQQLTVGGSAGGGAMEASRGETINIGGGIYEIPVKFSSILDADNPQNRFIELSIQKETPPPIPNLPKVSPQNPILVKKEAPYSNQ